MSDSTISLSVDEGHLGPRTDLWCYVLTAGRPTGSSTRHRLDAIEVIEVARGARLEWTRRGRTLVHAIDDPAMSNPHARIKRSGAGWVLEDLGAKNGCLRNGHREKSAVLLDGDVLELGRSCFVFRAAQPWRSDWTDDLHASSIPLPMRTLSSRWASELARLRDLAPTTLPLLVVGETGTGKERAVRLIHALSGRTGELVAVNCGAIARNLIESELFGFRKGSFSGATRDQPGLVAASSGGTLFLDEIGELPAEAQAALLRTLQEKEVLAIGATRPHPVDLRVVSATHRDLAAEVEAGRFRRDLFQRVQGATLWLPPLRERREDLGIIFDELLRASNQGISARSARALFAHPFGGNLRELEMAVRAGLAASDASGPLNLELVAAPVVSEAPTKGAEPLVLSEAELQRRDELIALLRTHAGNVAEVARVLGKAREQVYRWVTRYAIDLNGFR